MVNPYETTTVDSSPTIRRPVNRYILAFWLLMFTGFPVASHGLQLLNQEWQLIPTSTEIYDVEINGQSVSNETAIKYTIGTGLACLIVGLLLFAKSFLNWRHNRTIAANGL